MTEIVNAVHSRTLAAKLAAAVADVGGKLKADKRNNEQGYNYISADKVLAVGGQALADQGISIIPQVTGSELNWYDRGNGKGRWDAHLTMVMLITDGESEVLVPWAGWGSDYSVPDKAAYKGLTSGYKYFQMKLLSIGEGNEDGEHENEDEEKPGRKQPEKKTTTTPPTTTTPAETTAPTNGKQKETKQAAPADGTATPADDGNEIAAAGSKGMIKYAELCAQAAKLNIPTKGVTPGKTTVGELRGWYADLQAKIKAAEKPATEAPTA